MSQNLDFNKLLPSGIQNETLSSLVSNLFNRFVSTEQSVNIAGTVGIPISGNAIIQQPSLDRQENALVPSLFYQSGNKKYLYTFEDFVNKMATLDIDIQDMRTWMAEQSYNYSPPIDYDKFISYSNYYWTGSSLPAGSGPSWNPNNVSEFYVIERPALNDTTKMPVVAATTFNINLYANNRPPETFIIQFSSPTQFHIASNLGAVTSSVTTLVSTTPEDITPVIISVIDPVLGPGSTNLVSFNIINGTNLFNTGDYFTLNINYFTSSLFATLSPGTTINQGAIASIQSLSPMMIIDGVRITSGMRILVKNQTVPTQNGIYIVSTGNPWSLATDSTTTNLIINSAVYVTKGLLNIGTTWKYDNTNHFVEVVPNPVPNVNAWQLYNYWVHKDDLNSLAQFGISQSNSIQANRPIIEYTNKLQMNKFFDSTDTPSDSGISYLQTKTRFNQIPQFDLYRYDGTHAGMTSGLFFYAEGPNYITDNILLRRVVTTSTGDYVFGIGLTDSQNQFLYFKDNGTLKSIWQPGVTTATASTPLYNGTGNGSITITPTTTADNQEWTITCLTPITFSVNGTRSGSIGTLTIGTTFTCDDLTLGITAGTTPFIPGDNFSFDVWAPVSPRYIKQNPDGSIVNYPGGYAADQATANPSGAWLTPGRMFQNLSRELQPTIAFGDFINHGRAVLRLQDGFTGASFGDNNSRTLSFNPGLGGRIREFSSNFPLLASMLIEQDISVLTILDFIQQQYNIGLASITQFVNNSLAEYLGQGHIINTTTIDPNDPSIVSFEQYFETLRGQNMNLSTVFSDSTALVKNWPATLPMIGLLPKVQPTIGFDDELNIHTIVHHDNHISPVVLPNVEFDKMLVKTVVDRPDGTKSPGTFAQFAPANPYPGQLWMQTSTQLLYVYYPTGWILFNSSYLQNSLVLAVEQRLYDSVHPAQQLNLNLETVPVTTSQYQAVELAQFAAEYNYDMFAPDYVATNAFTWNYKQAVVPGLVGPTPARWYDLYNDYFDNFGSGVLATDRPDLYPWRLLGYATEPANWASLYACTVQATSNVVTAIVCANSNDGSLNGLGIIDGYNLNTGDRVLLTAQTNHTENGLWIAGPGAWGRASDPLVDGLTVNVTSGSQCAGTTWVITTPNPILLGTTPVTFQQARIWNINMWASIHATHPTLKRCVNINTDMLLPPYVSSTIPASLDALLTVIPVGISDGYVFGDNGPIELVWRKSLEYNYGLARSYFRLYPLQFLDKSWGETYMSVGTNLRTERNLMTSLPSSNFLLHGERLTISNVYTPAEIQARVQGPITWTGAANVSFVVTHCADNTTVFYAYVNGQLQGMVYEEVPFSFSYTDPVTGAVISFVNNVIEDLGIPFNMGDTINITFYNDIVDPSYVPPVANPLGEQGCVIPGIVTTVTTIPMVQVLPTYVHVPATTKIFKGVGQWFTNLIRYNSIDSVVSLTAEAYRGWSVNLVNRIGSLMRPDSLAINTAQGVMPDTGYSVVLKKSSNTKSLWISGLRIQLTKVGAATLTAPGYYVPVGVGADWVFRVEVYNNAYPQATYYVLDTAGPYETFNVLDQSATKLAWNRYMNVLSTETIVMPLQITGIQNVINFVYGYSNYLQDQGFKINASDVPMTDQLTGRNIDWQLEIEKFINQVYLEMSPGQGTILNPFMDKLYVQTPIGLQSPYTESNFMDAFSTQACYDVIGSIIPVNKLNVIRTDDQTITYSQTPIYSAHIFLDEYEHAIVFNDNFSSDPASATVFNSFLGEYMQTVYLTFSRQDVVDSKPTFDGFFLSGDNVARNFTAATDNIANYYDSDKTFNDPVTAQHAMSLVGFQTKDYFDQIDISPTTQLNFWKGMIAAKGTNLTIDAFANYVAFNNTSTDEFWAYKLATYGDARERTMPELKVQPADVVGTFTQLQFYSASDPNYVPLPLYTQVEANDDTRWYSIDDLGTTLRFDANAISESVTVTGTGVQYITLKNIYHNGDTMAPVVTGPSGASIVSANMLKVTQAGTYEVSGYTWLNPTKLSPIKLYDYSEQTLDLQLGLWHPAIGIHAYEPLEVINMVTDSDPANYSYTQQLTDNPNYMNLKPWGDNEVGRVWWDTSNLGYMPYYDATIFGSIESRLARWGKLADWASIDLYEWTESEFSPSQYNAQALLQQGDSTIDPSIALSGQVGFVNTYSSDRNITVRPVAWSQAGVGNGNAHPAFGPTQLVTMYVSGNTLIADSGRLAAINVTSGYNFGGWDTINQVPVNEVNIGTTVTYNVGSSLQLSNPVLVYPSVQATGTIATISVENVPDNSIYGTIIGAISLYVLNAADGTVSLRMLSSTGGFQDMPVTDWYSDNLLTNSSLTYVYEAFGLQVVITRSTIGTIVAGDIATAIANSGNDIYVRECVDFTAIVPITQSLFVNDPSDPLFGSADYMWKTWPVPSQALLNVDLPPPYNMWLPILGAEIPVVTTAAVITEMGSGTNTWILPSGITITRYNSTWTPMAQLMNTKMSHVSNGVNVVSFTVASETSLDQNRLSIYINNAQIAPALYTVFNNVITLSKVYPEASIVSMLYRQYTPTALDLSFDPTVADNVKIQTWYVQDYEYTQKDVRDSSGNITGSKYYFWVTNKTIPQVNQTMSLSQAAQILEDGESTYTTFSRLLPDSSSSSGAGYDSCAIAGLNIYVTKTNSYKLRFLRDFTLRDDPEQISLKNVHTEWLLINRHQVTVIPQQLWAVLTNAACGQDPLGNQLPSLVRTNYDNKYNTNYRYGFGDGQIFADTSLIQESIVNTILNTSLTIDVGTTVIPEYITVLNMSQSALWFSTPAIARTTMNLIYEYARANQINEIFFNALNVALACNYEMTDIFKTSYITVNSSTVVAQQTQGEQVDEFY
jgi:hypothetical protein